MKSALLAPVSISHPDSDLELEAHDIVVFSHLRWEFVTQRPQHLISRFSQKQRIFFVEEPISYTNDNYGGVKKKVLSPNLVLLQPQMNLDDYPKLLTPHIHRLLQNKQRPPIIWFYSPSFISMADRLESSLIVFDCMDELSAFKGASSRLIAQEKQLLSLADIVFTGGKSLFEAKAQKHANVHCFPSSVDRLHFEKSLFSETKMPVKLKKLPHPIVGFYGVIDERLDLNLIKKTAALLPKVSFVFIGPLAKISPSDLPQANNLHYFGPKSYAELPNYLKAFDVAFMPFALNESTTFISPTKTLEFMAAQKPIVSTAIHDVVRDYSRVVSIVSSPQDAATAICEYLVEKPFAQAKRCYLQNQVISHTSWDITAKKMSEEMTKSLRRKQKITDQIYITPIFSKLSLELNVAK